jgi:hypothetical protein
MKNFKNYTTTASGLVIMMVLFLVPISESKSPADDVLKRLATVSMLKAETASDEAFQEAEKQRRLVRDQELLRSSARESTKRMAGPVTPDNQQRPQPGRLTSREIAREKAILQLLEANARRSVEVLESVKRLSAELDRRPTR